MRVFNSLAVILFGSLHTLPLSHQQIRLATHRKTEKEKHLVDGRWGGGGGGAKSYDSEKIWSSINYSILPDFSQPAYNSASAGCPKWNHSDLRTNWGWKVYSSEQYSKKPLAWVAVFVSCEVSLPDPNKILKIVWSTGAKMILVKTLKVPKCEIFHLFDFNDFYGIKSV